MSAGIYLLPRHPAGTLACTIEYCLASLRFIFCLSDTSCHFLVCIFVFPEWRSKTHLLSSDREQQGHCRTSGDIFLSVRKQVMDFCCCLKYLSVSLCVWCLNVMCEEYLTRSNLLNPKKRTFDHGLLHCIRPFSSERAVITGILRDAVRFIYPRQDVCMHEQAFKQKLSLAYGICGFPKQSHFIKQSLPQSVLCIC